ncbi:MAG: HU family DNA-binding protein [Nitrospinota bacterium]
MTKSDLAEKLAEKINVNKQHAEGIINMFTNSIIEALAKGDKVEIRGFGSFRVRERAAKEGRNPKTGEKVYVPPKKVPFFKTGKDFRAIVNR